MSRLQLGVWNDDEDELKKWAEIAEEDGFEIKTKSSSKFANQVAEDFQASFHDLILVDVVHEGREEPHEAVGLEVARLLREFDPLVPIVAVTKFPERAYDVSELSELALCGLYEASVMRPGMFREVAIRTSLNQWRSSFPEHVLVRRAISALRSITEEDSSGVLGDLETCLRRLPFSRSIDSWHEQLSEALEEALRDRDFAVIADAYASATAIFRKADPFFMAAKLGRRHLSHNVQVFLLGIILMLEVDAIRLRAAAGSIGRPRERLIDAILIWGCVATTHDLAYLSQHLVSVSGAIKESVESLRPAVESATGKTVAGLPSWSWPDTHHSEVGAHYWKKACEDATDKREIDAGKIIEAAIARHDSNRASLDRLGPDKWASFLAVLCDELQDWHRERHEIRPGIKIPEEGPWDQFALELLRIDRDDTGTTLEIQFTAKDYPVFIKDYVGNLGAKEVRKRLADILRVLKDNLFFPEGLKIALIVEFVSRSIDPAISSQRLLKA